MEINLGICKCREVKTPEYGTDGAAGIDFFVPTLNDETFREIYEIPQNKEQIRLGKLLLRSDNILIRGSGRLLLPSGIKANLSDLCKLLRAEYDMPKYMDISLQVKNKSGVGTKLGFDRLAELIDSDYQGEIGISIVNTGEIEKTIFGGDKIIQMVITPIIRVSEIRVYQEKDLFLRKTKRGEKGFGKGSGK